MNIAFVTGCLEPGRDGVGDYTRDLASACVRAGHPCALVALNDPFVAVPTEADQQARGVSLSTLRLPPASSWAQRVATAAAFHGVRSADWMSLQFVPYALHPKGIVAGLDRHLARLASRRLVHVMFHELWIGAERGASLKHRVVGRLQRASVLRLDRALAPALAHTSNAAYASMLARAGVPVRVLPLCGSVPIAATTGGEWLARELAARGVPLQFVRPRDRAWWFGVFGSIHPEWVPDAAFAAIAAAAHTAGRRVTIVSAGRQGPGAASWAELPRRFGPEFAFCALGELPLEQLSWFLQGIDFGLATTPWQLIGKSATAAAMVDHGLPVLVSRDDVAFGGVASQPGPLLHRLGPDTSEWLLQARAPRTPRDGIDELQRRFLADLSRSVAQRPMRRSP